MPIIDSYSVDKYVVFMDLLGFSARVEKADKDETTRQDILKILEIVKSSLTTNPDIGMHLTHFSDSIVISASRNPFGLLEILESIICLSSNLINYDCMVRGALTVGGIHHDNNFVYGNGLIRAYKMEKCECFPRTIISDEVYSDIKAAGSSFENQVTQLNDDKHFVHYLRDYSNYRTLPIYSGKVVLDSSGVRIIDLIQHRLNTNSSEVLPKVNWFQTYWNSKVAIHNVFSEIKTGVLERNLGHLPTMIVRRRLIQE